MAWQYRPASGDEFELISRRENVLDYETVDSRQAGWKIVAINEGALDLTYERGPGVSAIPFLNEEGSLFSTLQAKNLRATRTEDTLVLSGRGRTVRLQSHPANALTLPDGQEWGLVESYDDLATRNPFEFEKARVSFFGYSVGVSAGCNGGGMSFAQWDDRFIPGLLIMTQMACPNDGDAVAQWLVRPGPAFQRDDDQLWRDFPEGRVLFEARPVEAVTLKGG